MCSSLTYDADHIAFLIYEAIEKCNNQYLLETSVPQSPDRRGEKVFW